MRTPVVAGNWKMNMTLSGAMEIINGIKFGLKWPPEVDVIVAPPFPSLKLVSELAKDSYLGVAAQNIHHEEKGAYTGEVSAEMVKDAGAQVVIIGHSERREYFGETNEDINNKLKTAQKNELIPIMCFGETLEERESGNFFEILAKQVLEGLGDLTKVMAQEVILAYEPVWAIGTGKTASPNQVEEVHAKVRALLRERFSPEVGDSMRILYGGSVKPGNAKEIFSLPNVDGGLIGGASLKSHDFIQIIKATEN